MYVKYMVAAGSGGRTPTALLLIIIHYSVVVLSQKELNLRTMYGNYGNLHWHSRASLY